MPPTMPVMSEFTEAELETYTVWLAFHLPAARAKARGVSIYQASEGVEADPAMGRPAIDAMDVDPKTIQRTERRAKGPGPKRREDQVRKMLEWVRKYLHGPEECAGLGCSLAGRKPTAPSGSSGVVVRKQRG